MLRFAFIFGQIVGPVQKNAEKIDEDEKFELYGLDEEQFAEVVRSERKFKMSSKGMSRLPYATLLSIVATFDTLVVDILAKMLRLQSDWLEKSQREIPLSRLASASSVEQIIKEEISEELYLFSRGSHSEQADYIRNNFGLYIKKDWKRWPDYIEVFERRNLVAHGETKFHGRYVDICKKEVHKGAEKLLNKDVYLTESYLKQSCNILTEFLVLLSFSLFRKFVREKEDDAFTNLNEAVFNFLQAGHHVVAINLAEYALSLKNVKISEKTRLMLIVNHASAVRHEGDKDKSNEILNQYDWSASSDIFKICVASVRGDSVEFSRLLPEMKVSQKIEAYELLSWPCFKFMLEDEIGRACIDEHFDLKASISGVADTGSIEADGPSADIADSQADESTFH